MQDPSSLVAASPDLTDEKHAAASLAERARQLTTMYGFVARLHRADSLADVYDAALDAIVEALRCDRASLLLLDGAGVMRFVGWRGLSDAYRAAVEGHTPWALTDHNPQPVCVPDIAAADLDAQLKGVVRAEGIGALAFIPLVASGTLIGKFMTYYDAPHVYGSSEIDLGLSIARQLALSIDRRRANESLRAAYLEARKRQREAESLAAVARTLSTLNLDAMLTIIAESACALLDAEAATVFRLDQDAGTLVLVAGGGPGGTTVNKNVAVPRDTGLVGLAVASREAVVSDDILGDPRIVYEPALRARIETTRHRVGLAVPLSVQGRTTGALFVGRLAGRTFEDDEVRLAAAFANQAAVAMANAELYHQAQRANQAKDDFLAMLGHELRNPLGAITGAVAVLKAVDARDPTVSGRARDVIHRQTQHLARLVDDLLDVARVTSGKVRLNLQPVDLGSLVASAMNAWRATGRFARHEVTVDVASMWVDGDETRLEQVLENLVGNALKYTPQGGLVHVRVSSTDDVAVLDVADTGPGIPGHLRESIFELFVQGERALDRAQGGLGIGLTLVKALVGLHDGTVTATSDSSRGGSRFTVRLPRVALPASAMRVPAPADTRTARRILVIEDNEDARDILRMQLRLEGHDVYDAIDGPAGVEATARVIPDVVLVDVGLPGLDGYEVARRIRATPEGKSIALIALTGYGQAEDRRRALAAGFDIHLTKPVTAEHLARAIAEATATRRPDCAA